MRLAKLALALNTNSPIQAIEWAEAVENEVDIFKVGLPLLLKEGPHFIHELERFEREIFLDAKLHDIPSVVGSAVEAAAFMGVDFLTIHALGGFDMLKEAKRAKKGVKPMLLGVTVLSSVGEKGIERLGHSSRRELNLFLAQIAVEAGLDGVVVSGEEVKEVRDRFPEILIVCPGIRPPGAEIHDQRATLTPEHAVALGADIIVVGRPITQASNPGKIAKSIKEEIKRARR